MSIINKLLGLDIPQPKEQTVTLTRFPLDITLREIDFDTLVAVRSGQDPELQYLLKSIVSPNFKDPAWYQDKMHEPTPLRAMKKLLRPGEIEKLCKTADALNGYTRNALLIKAPQEEIEAHALAEAMEELEKK